MIADMAWLSDQAKIVHGYFQSFFFILITVLMLTGIVCEYFKLPFGAPAFGQLVGRAFIAIILLVAYPEITNVIADVADAIASHLGDLNAFNLVTAKMATKLHDLSWSWVSFKDSVMMIISFLTFFLLYFSVHIANAFYIYAWALLYVFSPILIALYVLPVTARATSALFRSLIEVACWKIVWAVIATLLWSSALGKIDQGGIQVSFLTAICFNIILAGSLLVTPFIVKALAGAGIATVTRDISAVAIGGLVFAPTAPVQSIKKMRNKLGIPKFAPPTRSASGNRSSSSPRRTIFTNKPNTES